MSDVILYEDEKETIETLEQKRRRLSTELHLIKTQFNSKLAECLDIDLAIDIVYKNGEASSDENNLITSLDCSYQTKRKYYR
jgi:hypothetical protein